jgi:hypothetical protein
MLVYLLLLMMRREELRPEQACLSLDHSLLTVGWREVMKRALNHKKRTGKGTWSSRVHTGLINPRLHFSECYVRLNLVHF